jgi:hypothetical protein
MHVLAPAQRAGADERSQVVIDRNAPSVIRPGTVILGENTYRAGGGLWPALEQRQICSAILPIVGRARAREIHSATVGGSHEPTRLAPDDHFLPKTSHARHFHRCLIAPGGSVFTGSRSSIANPRSLRIHPMRRATSPGTSDRRPVPTVINRLEWNPEPLTAYTRGWLRPMAIRFSPLPGPLDPCLMHNWSKTSIEIAHDSCRNGVALLSPAWRNIGSAIKNPHGYVLPSVFLALPLHRVPGSLRPSPRPTVSSPGRSGRGPDCLPRNASVRRLESDRSGGRVVVGGLLGVRIAGIAVLVVGRVRGRRRGRRGVRGRRWVW